MSTNNSPILSIILTVLTGVFALLTTWMQIQAANTKEEIQKLNESSETTRGKLEELIERGDFKNFQQKLQNLESKMDTIQNSDEEQESKLKALYSQHEIPVGTIIASFLDEREFYLQVGENFPFNRSKNKWCIANGQENIIGTDYYNSTGKQKIDDLRGYFLRGLDLSGKVDPDGRNRKLGGIQADAFQGHYHNVDTREGTITGPNEGQKPLSFQYEGRTPAARKPVSDGENGEPRIASETRPINKTVNYFIKVNF